MVVFLICMLLSCSFTPLIVYTHDLGAFLHSVTSLTTEHIFHKTRDHLTHVFLPLSLSIVDRALLLLSN